MASDDHPQPTGPSPQDDIVRRVYARRERHGRRPLLVRALAVLVGSLLTAVGAVAVIPLPEAGVPALLGGLGLLALEFDWAAAALVRVERLWRRFRTLPPGARVAILAGLAAVLAVALIMLL